MFLVLEENILLYDYGNQVVKMELLCLLKDPMFNWQEEINRLTNRCFWTGRSVLLQMYAKTDR